MYLEDFSLSLPTVTLIKDHLVNQENGEVRYFFTFSITPTGKSPIIFSDWNLSKYSRDSMLSFSVLIYQSIILDFNYHCCKPSKFYFSYSILNFTSKMWKPPINVKLLFFLNNLEDFIKYI